MGHNNMHHRPPLTTSIFTCLFIQLVHERRAKTLFLDICKINKQQKPSQKNCITFLGAKLNSIAEKSKK